MMMHETILFATSTPPSGRAVLAIGVTLCMAVVGETIASRRHPADLWWRVRAWVERLFVAGVGTLMIISGARILEREEYRHHRAAAETHAAPGGGEVT